MKSLRQLDLNLLLVFEAIHSNGNVSRAAKALGLTQPTISNALSRLRVALDDPLFVRTGRGVAPTARAQDLIDPVRRALREINSAVQATEAFDPATAQRQFNLHIFDTMEPIVVPPLVDQAMKGSGLSFRFLVAPSILMEDAVESGAADIGIGLSPSNRPSLRWDVLCALDLVVIARQGHPELSGSISEEQFQRLAHVSLDLTPGAIANAHKIHMSRRLERRDVVKVNRPSAIAGVVASTDLIGMINRANAEILADTHKLQILETPFELSDQVVHIVWRQTNSNEPGVVWLKEQIKAAVHARGGALPEASDEIPA